MVKSEEIAVKQIEKSGKSVLVVMDYNYVQIEQNYDTLFE